MRSDGWMSLFQLRRVPNLKVKLVQVQLFDDGWDLLLRSLPIVGFGEFESAVGEVAGCARGWPVFVTGQLLIRVLHFSEYGAICIVEDVDDCGIGRHSLEARVTVRLHVSLYA